MLPAQGRLLPVSRPLAVLAVSSHAVLAVDLI